MKVIVKDYEVMTPQQRRDLTPSMQKMCGKIGEAELREHDCYIIDGFWFAKDMVIML